MIRDLFMSSFFKCIFCKFRWYRKWFGGRWELHWIEVCKSHIWMDMHKDRKWPEWKQPCSHGVPIIEDYPVKARIK